MLIMTGWLRFNPDDREDVLAGLIEVAKKSRLDSGCVDYWWAEAVDEPNTFRFFECWESAEQFQTHRAQPYEDEFMTNYVSRITGADAHSYAVTDRRSAMG